MIAKLKKFNTEIFLALRKPMSGITHNRTAINLNYYDRTVNLLKTKDLEQPNKSLLLLVKFDKPVKNADGYMEIDFKGGRTYTMTLSRINAKTPDRFSEVKEAIPEGEEVPYLLADWNPIDHDFPPEQINGRPVRIFLPGFPPPEKRNRWFFAVVFLCSAGVAVLSAKAAIYFVADTPLIFFYLSWVIAVWAGVRALPFLDRFRALLTQRHKRT